jgi:succinate-semialdehyde dehydrogenase/glutarate-semialdehyde dehydrogenase
MTDTHPTFTPVDPATGQVGAALSGHSRQEALAIAESAHRAFLAWRETNFAHRASLMKAAAQVLRRHKDGLAGLMTAEMGKTLSDGRAEVEKCAFNCEHFADHAEAYLAREPVDMSDTNGPGPKAFVTFNPLGVVLAVMPWNFPLWQVFRFAAPTLMAGNGAVLKHASNVPACALAIEQVFQEAGFPKDLFRTLLIPSADVGPLIDSPSIAAVTLTGSVGAGRAVASAAGAALKKSVLELGGSDAYIILEDADIALAARVCATARMVNAGQSCIAGKRFIVVEQVADAFEAALVEAMSAWVPADPRDPATKMGPLVSLAARDEIPDQVLRSIDKGARLLLGGTVPAQPGAWYPPTVLADVVAGQPAHDDEVFGPVAAIIRARDEADAIRIANDNPYGLGSGVITSDLARGERIAAESLEAGMAFVNKNAASDPRLPFGGVKHSGNGRECGRYGILEFVNVKTVVVG